MLEFISQSPNTITTDILVVPVSENKLIIDDPELKPLIKNAKDAGGFSGKTGQDLTFYSPEGFSARQVMFMGIGKTAELTAESFRAMVGKAIGIAKKREARAMAVLVPTPNKLPVEWRDLGQAMMEGALLGSYEFNRFKKTKSKKNVETVTFVSTSGLARRFEKMSEDVIAICDGALAARDWVSTPSNAKRPEMFADMIAKVGRDAGLSVTILGEEELKRKKFNALLAVAQGSTSSPRLVIMEYIPKRQTRETIALVGKGITFDSGGLNLKPTGSMEEMKMDMAGAAAVAGSMLGIARLRPQHRVIGVIPIAENMPSGDAYRPGDIFKTLDGKTIEISNTDAEGRLLLADAITYTIRTYKPDMLIDFATLTGACVVALGDQIAGVFSNNDALAADIVTAGKEVHERCWAMPMPDDYKEMLKSKFADLSTTGGSRFGGSITAALFLSEFVEDTKWAHIDIAGPAWTKKQTAYTPPGGTGFGVRLICRLLENAVRDPKEKTEKIPED